MIVCLACSHAPIERAYRHPVVTVSPAVARRGQPAILSVRGIRVPTLEARLVGAATPAGVAFGWAPLRRSLGGWFLHLRRPALPGVYPIELRARPGGRILRSKQWLFRILDRGTLSLPSFSTPEGVARWWVRAVGQRIVALKRWPRPAFAAPASTARRRLSRAGRQPRRRSARCLHHRLPQHRQRSLAAARGDGDPVREE